MSITPPTVGVVIPTYNQAEFLRQALQSVVNQDFKNWQAIVVNNFSMDHTRAVVAEIGDSRITCIDFRNDGIIAASRNLAIQQISTDYIAFLDSDDWWKPEKLSRCVQRLEDGFDLVCHSEEWRSEHTARIVHYGPESRAHYQKLLLGGNCLSTSAVVGRTKMFQDLNGFSTDPHFVTAEDYELWLRIAKENYQFTFLTEVLGVFRIHAASASSSVDRNTSAEKAVVAHHLATAEFATPRVQRRRLALSHYGAARAYHSALNFQRALREFLLSLRLSPLFPRAYAGMCLSLFSLLRNSKQHSAHLHD